MLGIRLCVLANQIVLVRFKVPRRRRRFLTMAAHLLLSTKGIVCFAGGVACIEYVARAAKQDLYDCACIIMCCMRMQWY